MEIRSYSRFSYHFRLLYSHGSPLKSGERYETLWNEKYIFLSNLSTVFIGGIIEGVWELADFLHYFEDTSEWWRGWRTALGKQYGLNELKYYRLFGLQGSWLNQKSFTQIFPVGLFLKGCGIESELVWVQREVWSCGGGGVTTLREMAAASVMRKTNVINVTISFMVSVNYEKLLKKLISTKYKMIVLLIPKTMGKYSSQKSKIEIKHYFPGKFFFIKIPN